MTNIQGMRKRKTKMPSMVLGSIKCYQLGPSLGVGLLSHMCLTFSGTAKLFSKVAVPFSFPTSNVWGLQFCYILARFVIVCLFDYSCCSGCEVVPHWFWFPWWLMILTIFSCAYQPFTWLLWRNVYSSPLPTFNRAVYLFIIEF